MYYSRERFEVVAPKSGDVHWHTRAVNKYEWDFVDIPSGSWPIPNTPERRREINDQFEAHFNRSLAMSRALSAELADIPFLSRNAKSKMRKCISVSLWRLAEPNRHVGQGTQIVRLKIKSGKKCKNWNGRLHQIMRGSFSCQSQSGNMAEKLFNENEVVGIVWNADTKMWTITIER